MSISWSFSPSHAWRLLEESNNTKTGFVSLSLFHTQMLLSTKNQGTWKSWAAFQLRTWHFVSDICAKGTEVTKWFLCLMMVFLACKVCLWLQVLMRDACLLSLCNPLTITFHLTFWRWQWCSASAEAQLLGVLQLTPDLSLTAQLSGGSKHNSTVAVRGSEVHKYHFSVFNGAPQWRVLGGWGLFMPVLQPQTCLSG